MKFMKPLSIFLVNCDWTDAFDTPFFMFKLKRDRLRPELNNFFVFSWARKSYTKKKERFATVHVATKLDIFRPLLDIATLFYVPYQAWRHKVRPDVWLCYDFGFVPAVWVAQAMFGGKVIMCLNNQPRVYSGIRRFGMMKSFYSLCVEKLCSSFVSHYFTINATMKKYIEGLGVAPSAITVFSMNTIESDEEFIRKMDKGVLRRKYGIPSSQKIILTVARLEAEKNYPRLLELFSGLGDDYTLIALGRGSLLPQLLAQCKHLGIEKRVIFPGLIPREDIWNYYADADVFVVLSKVEALGVVFWEAMYAGVPVIGSTADGIVETIGSDGERGRIWSEDKGQSGFNHMVDFSVTQHKARDEMCVRAQKFVAEKMLNQVSINDVVESM